MSSQVDEALDRLRAYLDDAYPLNSAGHSALATVRQRLAKQDTELERLRRHPDAWSQEAFDQQKSRAEAAEAEVRRLTALKDEVVELSAKLERGLLNASAEIVRLTEGLRHIESGSTPDGQTITAPDAYARAWLDRNERIAAARVPVGEPNEGEAS